MKKSDGKLSKKESLTLILVNKPNSIRTPIPSEESWSKKLNFIPNNKPKPPNSSNMPISVINFSSLKRINSSCIFFDFKSKIP